MRALLHAIFVLVWVLASTPAPALGWCVGGAPPARDADGDGLNDIQEQFFSTDPGNPDTDGDTTPDGLEDADGDGLPNQDEPHVFSVEIYEAPFGTPSIELVLEGTQLFVPDRKVRSATVRFPDTLGSRRAQHAARNRRSRIHLRLTPSRARMLLGEGLDGNVLVDSLLGASNALHPVPMPCATDEPHLMGAAVVELRTPSEPDPLRYVALGGCNLLAAGRRPMIFTRFVVGGDSYEIAAPFGETTLLPTRVLLPLRWRAVDDPVLPKPPDLVPGTIVQIETPAGASNAVVVEPAIAQLRIPDSHLDEDHDADRLTSRRELELGTDPLVYDTDRDGLSDWREVRRGTTDPLDPDSDGDGELDAY
jgi:hypothetical protein